MCAEFGYAADEKCDVVGAAAGVPTFYQVVQVISLAIVCLSGWKSNWTYAPRKHSFWKILTSNYQPVAVVEDDARSDGTDRLSHGGPTGSFLMDSASRQLSRANSRAN